MKKLSALLVAALILAACRSAVAIPPPWKLEKEKGESDLILIVKTGETKPVANIAGANHKVTIEAVEVLKGEFPKPADDTQPVILFHQQQPKNPAIRMHIAGTGHPKIGTGQTALAFLRKDPKHPGCYRVNCGSFGYVVLDTKTEKELAAIEKRLRTYQAWSAKIKDETTRLVMESYYDSALSATHKLTSCGKHD